MSKPYKEQPLEIKQIIFDLACDCGFSHYSTIEEIDYKFWEDTPVEWIAINLAEKIVSLNKIKKLDETIYETKKK